MSGTANEFEEPGGNYPDRRDVDGAQPTGDAARSDAGVGGAVHEDADDAGVPGAEATQDEPLLAQNSPTTQDKLDGIAAQTRMDLGDESDERYQDVLRQRLSDSGIQLTDEQVSSLAQRSAQGGGGSGV